MTKRILPVSDKPVVKVNRNGVFQTTPGAIFRSEVGQREIRKTVEVFKRLREKEQERRKER